VWRHASAIHAVSDDIWQRAISRGCPPDTLHRIIHGSVDGEFFDPGDRDHADVAGSEEHPLRVLSVGRLVWKKGHEFSLRAIRTLLDHGIHAELTIIGEGRLREALLFEAHDLGIAHAIHLAGAADRDEVRDAMREADVFLLSSLSEGFGIAVAEAQAMQLPVVSTDAEGLRENVLDGVTGFIVPRRDPEAIAEKLQCLAADPALRTSMGQAGRTRVLDRFRVEQEIDAIECLYHDVLDLPARARDRYESLRANGGPPGEPDIFAYLQLEEAFNERMQMTSS
jgi:colanic acid/amylovoran biosynthesis glycosyltransferase